MEVDQTDVMSVFPTDLMSMVSHHLNLKDWFNLIEAYPNWCDKIGSECITHDHAWINVDMSSLTSLKSLIAPNVRSIINVKWPPNLTRLHCPKNRNLTKSDLENMPDSLVDLDLTLNQNIHVDHLPNRITHFRNIPNGKIIKSLDEIKLPTSLQTLAVLDCVILESSEFPCLSQLTYLDTIMSMNTWRLPTLPSTLKTLIFEMACHTLTGSNRQFANWITCLPIGLEHLTLKECDIDDETCMTKLPPRLKTLDVTGVDFMAGNLHIPRFIPGLPLTLNVFKSKCNLTMDMFMDMSHRLFNLHTLEFRSINFPCNPHDHHHQTVNLGFGTLKTLKVEQICFGDRTWLTQLPNGLQSLTIEKEQASSVINEETFLKLPTSITHLDLGDNFANNHPMTRMVQLKTLVLGNRMDQTWPRWITQLPETLTDLRIAASLEYKHESFFETISWPKQLERLELKYPQHQNLFIRRLVPDIAFTTMKIECSSVDQVQALPRGLLHLKLDLNHIVATQALIDALPPGLITLDLIQDSNQCFDASIDLSHLPQSLENLELPCLSKQQVKQLPLSLLRITMYAHGHCDYLSHLHTNVEFVRIHAPDLHHVYSYHPGWKIELLPPCEPGDCRVLLARRLDFSSEDMWRCLSSRAMDGFE